MEATNFKHLLTSHAPVTLTEVDELTTLLDKFPYLQSARALQLKGLKTNFDTRYNQALKITAAYTTDRSVLFDYITSNEFVVFVSKNKPLKEADNNNSLTDTTNYDTISNIDAEELFNKSVEILKVEQDLEIGTPLSFSIEDTYSFHEWLQLTSVNPIDRKIDTVKEVPLEKSYKNNLQSQIIENFINAKPKITQPDKNSPIEDISAKSLERNDDLMTETLARVYLEQKKFKSAIKAYKILSLKYPEKSGYFADQIKAISILQNNNKS